MSFKKKFLFASFATVKFTHTFFWPTKLALNSVIIVLVYILCISIQVTIGFKIYVATL